MRLTFPDRLFPRVVGVALAAVLATSCQASSSGSTTTAPTTATIEPAGATVVPGASLAATEDTLSVTAEPAPTDMPSAPTAAPLAAAGDGAAPLRSAIRDVAKAVRPGVVQITNQQQIQPGQFNQ